MFLVSKIVRSACLTKSDYAVFNLTALDAIITNSTSKVCPAAFKLSGQCVTDQSIIDIFEQTKKSITASALSRFGKIAGAIQKAGKNFGASVDNAAKFKNGTLPAAANNATNNATNNSSNANNSGKKPKVDKAQLKLDQNLKKMQDLQKKIQDQKSFNAALTEKSGRQNCFVAQFKLLRATLCGVASGNATSFVQKSASGAISSVLVNFNSTNDVIEKCGKILVQNCDMIALQQSLADTLGSTANGTAPATPAYCADMNALTSCTNNLTSCSDELKKTIVGSNFAPFASLLFKDVNTDVIESNTNTLAESLDVTTATVRRLQSTQATIGYSVASTGLNAETLGGDSTLSSDNAESSVTVPDTLGSSASALIQTILAFTATFVLSMIA